MSKLTWLYIYYKGTGHLAKQTLKKKIIYKQPFFVLRGANGQEQLVHLYAVSNLWYGLLFCWRHFFQSQLCSIFKLQDLIESIKHQEKQKQNSAECRAANLKGFHTLPKWWQLSK